MNELTNLTTTPNGVREKTLRSGAVITIRKFKGRDIKEAMKVAKGLDEESIIFAIMAMTCTYNGKPLVMEDILDEIPGPDVLEMMGEFSGLF